MSLSSLKKLIITPRKKPKFKLFKKRRETVKPKTPLPEKDFSTIAKEANFSPVTAFNPDSLFDSPRKSTPKLTPLRKQFRKSLTITPLQELNGSAKKSAQRHLNFVSPQKIFSPRKVKDTPTKILVFEDPTEQATFRTPSQKTPKTPKKSQTPKTPKKNQTPKTPRSSKKTPQKKESFRNESRFRFGKTPFLKAQQERLQKLEKKLLESQFPDANQRSSPSNQLQEKLKSSNACFANMNLSASQIHLICDALRHNTTVTELDFSNNDLDTTCILYIADLLKANSALKSVNLNGNWISEKGIIHLLAALKKNCTLLELKMDRTNASKEHLEAIDNLLVRNNRINSK